MKRIQWQRLAVSVGGIAAAAYFVAGCSPTSTDVLPHANAGLDQVVNQQAWVHLAGSGNDVAAPIARYEWQQTSGTAVELLNGDHTNPSFIAPAIDVDETLSFSFTIYNALGQRSSDSLDVQVKAENTPSKRRINDTGITVTGNYPNGENVACIGLELLEQQDCTRGRDSDSNDSSDGRVGFSFTKIGADGEVLPSDAPQWSCVLDNVTGFMWEVKTLANKDEVYLAEQAKIDYPNQVNSLNSGAGLCGFSDWRLPEQAELHSLVDLGGSAPSIDLSYFPYTEMAELDGLRSIEGSYRVSSSFGTSVIDFRYGFSVSAFEGETPPELEFTLVRLVRSSNPLAAIDYVVDVPNQTVWDRTHSLMWMRCLSGHSGDLCRDGELNTYTWSEAILAVKDINQEGYGGFNDWRLANVKELGLLIDRSSQYGSRINQDLFPGDYDSFSSRGQVWSSSVSDLNAALFDGYAGSTSWVVDFGSSFIFPSNRDIQWALKLVRDTD